MAPKPTVHLDTNDTDRRKAGRANVTLTRYLSLPREARATYAQQVAEDTLGLEEHTEDAERGRRFDGTVGNSTNAQRKSDAARVRRKIQAAVDAELNDPYRPAKTITAARKRVAKTYGLSLKGVENRDRKRR